ncbi:MAG TPA: hypothetical protein VGP07_16305 [Polyangia bacterium]|jgi:hypothetical protein
MGSHGKMKFKALCQLPPEGPGAAPRFLAVLDGEVVRLEASDGKCTRLTVHRDVEVVDSRPGPVSPLAGASKSHPVRKDSDP